MTKANLVLIRDNEGSFIPTYPTRDISADSLVRVISLDIEVVNRLVEEGFLSGPESVGSDQHLVNATITLGSVYFIGFGDYIKIGFSNNLKGRLNTLQTGSPEKLVLYASMRGTHRKEIELHQRFAHLRLKGEWFRKAPDILDFIEQIKTGEAA